MLHLFSVLLNAACLMLLIAHTSASSRVKLHKLPIPVYKPTWTSWLHKVPRKEYLRNPALRFPIYERLPQHWKDDYESKEPMIIHQDLESGTKRPQHRGLWKKDERGNPVRVENIPLSLRYSPEEEQGIWAGETYVYGYGYPRGDKMTRRLSRRWSPQLWNKTMYSEILDRTISTTFTPLALDLIDEAYGFDSFILKLRPSDLPFDRLLFYHAVLYRYKGHSTKRLRKFGSALKREMLLTLANKDEKLYPNDPEKRMKIYNKYKEYAIDEERASWVGLTLVEAMQKQWQLEKDSGTHEPTPLLHVYTNELKAKLTEASGDKTTTTLR